jgi:hypothetical protein
MGTLREKLSSLFSYVDQLELLFIEYVAKKEKDEENKLLKELNTSFIKWLNDKLFTISSSSLPVFGFFKHVYSPLNQSSFGYIQILIIKYLSQERMYKQLPNNAIHLFGCWYKNYDQMKFYKHFVNDKQFFDDMVALLQENKVEFKHFRPNEKQLAQVRNEYHCKFKKQKTAR